MREIKFRGLYKGTWVYGNLIQGLYEGKPFTQIENSDSSDFQKWEVDSKTVGQFTGITDINGEQVYEGDVVIEDGIEKEIMWFPEGAQFIAQYRDNAGEWDIMCSKETGGIYEVIGHIYEEKKP